MQHGLCVIKNFAVSLYVKQHFYKKIMKKIIINIIFLSFCFSYSQNGFVEYGYIESLGLGNAQGLDYNAILLFDSNNSNYTSCKISLEKIEKISETKIVEKDGEVKAIFNGMGVSEEGNQVYFSTINKKLYSTLFYDEMIYINDGISNNIWNITKETKYIGKVVCIKATTTFRGRDYIAWFTTEIPVPYGPWKLNGLPGLIIEAYDTDKFVYWYFKNIQYPYTKTEVVKTLTDKESEKFIDYSIFKTLQENERKKIEEKNIIFMKENQGIEITSPKLNEMFIECE